ncbi:folylpolyglutamate synthase/dihydrofolate synthase family protein [Comamonas sp. JC664]|uniref:bifunctional folylpolyglutamate synthase/dihydrofolate synthase n=1 Tax=Comamonas sp. JC664 TaxID=2801917 RepID=UPI00174A19D5|nr:folylpolyglutamate synthase/dihydrofolate synthase family protein [Comamonas sp. JC664]MBL0693650.1 bifunctional folylpolyglutamate synthase/dihydrofolate synthase [Comamonas sp. JC664]GHG73683.1 bifunctional folylpolyglutamate synthase/dihydrofolate synthase [Comamonas sp. KCTC 72670]
MERVQEALAALGHPERQYPALHVAGTNGKGSTCAMTAAALHAAGHRVGLYTSPHLVRVNERIRVDNEDISDADFGLRILEVLERYPSAVSEPMTYFEFGTVVALWHFAQVRVDVAVLETGLGGRLDATTAASPVVTAITPVSFDHMDYLGDTLTAIAGEKAGILKPGVPCIVARQAPEALEAILRKAEAVGAPLRLEGRDFFAERQPDGGLSYRGAAWNLEGLSVALRGPHQRQNAAVALACLEALQERRVTVPPEAARAGLASACWPGRLEEVGQGPVVLLDGAHNPAGVEVLLASLKDLYPGRRLHLVFGVVGDKDRGPMMRALFPECASVQLTPLETPRSLAPEAYLAEARALCQDVTAWPDVDAALAAARERATSDDLILGTGSLFLVGMLKARLYRNLGAMQQPP